MCMTDTCMHPCMCIPYGDYCHSPIYVLQFLLHNILGNPKGAKRAMLVGLCVSLTWLAIVQVVTLSLKDYIPRIFTSDPTIPQAINVHIYVMAASIFCDTLHSYLAGVIVGCGWQHVGAVFNVLWYWVVGAPLGVSLTLAVQLGALGYWIGQASAAFLLLCSYIVVTATINWKKRSEVAQRLAVLHQNENGQESESHCNKDTEMSKAMPSQKSPGENTTSDPEQRDAIKNTTAAEKPMEANSKCSNIESNPSEKNKNKTTVRWKTVVVRVLTAAIFITLCVGTVVISQVLVYRPTPCNSTHAGNMSECLSFQSQVFQTMATTSTGPLYTSPSAAVTSLNYLPSPTPTPQQL